MFSPRMRKWMPRVIAVLAGSVILLVVSLYTWIPGVVMSRLNHPVQSGPYTVSETARALHRTLFVADMHCDSLLWSRNLLTRDSRGLLDLPRMQEGNIGLQCFFAVNYIPGILSTKNTPLAPDLMAPMAFFEGWPAATWFSPRERALYMAGCLTRDAERSGGQLTVIQTREDLARFLERRKTEPGLAAGILGVEGLHCLEGDLENVRVLYHAGFRMMGPVHFIDSDVGGSAHSKRDGGLTPFGRKVIRYMEQHKVLTDLAHASPALIDDVLAMAARPPIVSHTGLIGACDTWRNLSDDAAKRIADKGGVIGIGFWPDAVCGNTPADIVRSIRHAVEVVGLDHVAIGSDFDGCTIPPFDASGMPLLTQALLEAGFSPEEIALIMGGNWVRMLLEFLPSEEDVIQQGLKE